MTKLEAWLETVQTEALRELSGTNMHGKNKAEVVAYIMRTPEARETALESMRKTLGLEPDTTWGDPPWGWEQEEERKLHS